MKYIGIKILIGFCIILFIVATYEAIIIKNNATTINKQAKQISELADYKEKLAEDNKNLTIEMELLKKSEEKNLHPIEKEVQDCIASVDTRYMTCTFEFSDCVYKSKDKWEKEIEKFLVQLKKFLSNEEYALLLESQKDWEQYRKSQIKFIENTYSHTSATIYHNYAAADIVSITEDRAKYFDWVLKIAKDR